MRITRRQLRKLITELTDYIIHDPVDATRHIDNYSLDQSFEDNFRSFYIPIAKLFSGFVPVAGQLVAINDMIHALTDVFMSKGDDGKIDAALAGFAFIPGIGRIVRLAFKASFKAAETGPGEILLSDAMTKAKEITAKLKKDYPDKFEK